jgi:hypothetical protein
MAVTKQRLVDVNRGEVFSLDPRDEQKKELLEAVFSMLYVLWLHNKGQ